MKSSRLGIGLSAVTGLVCFSVVLLGCANLQINEKTPLVSSVDTASAMTLQPTMTANRTPDFPITSLTLTSTFTLTPLPTIELDRVDATLHDFIMNQNNCHSHCFWGITPNQTTISELQNIFSQVGKKLVHTTQKGNKLFYSKSYTLKNGIVVSIVVRTQNEIIDSTRTDISFVNYEGDSPLQNASAFSPDYIISEYGIPNRVEFYLSNGPDDGSSPTTSYFMVMYFDSSDLIVRYHSRHFTDKDEIKICPLTDGLDDLTLWQGKDAEDAPSAKGTLLEKATSLTRQEFADLLLKQNSMQCFELRRAAFQQ
jgi:hypothetical protein